MRFWNSWKLSVWIIFLQIFPSRIFFCKLFFLHLFLQIILPDNFLQIVIVDPSSSFANCSHDLCCKFCKYFWFNCCSDVDQFLVILQILVMYNLLCKYLFWTIFLQMLLWANYFAKFKEFLLCICFCKCFNQFLCKLLFWTFLC